MSASKPCDRCARIRVTLTGRAMRPDACINGDGRLVYLCAACRSITGFPTAEDVRRHAPGGLT